MHCAEKSKHIIPEMNLRGLVPYFFISESVSYLYIPSIGPQMQYSKISELIVEIYTET
jgi:hypothetical protein